MPHTSIRIVDPNDPQYPSPDMPSVPIGVAGELWSAGYALQKGYWKNDVETEKVMVRDQEGMRWIMTGDQAIMDAGGYISIVGRIKDIIIRFVRLFLCLFDSDESLIVNELGGE